MPNTNQYATLAECKSRYSDQFLIRITNFVGVDAGTSVVDDRLTDALRDASDIIDGYLMGRYSTPLSPFPDHFIPDTCCIAVRLLIERKGVEKDSSEEIAVTTGKDCEKKFRLIAEGKIDLSIPDTAGDAPPISNIIASKPKKIFTETTLDLFL